MDSTFRKPLILQQKWAVTCPDFAVAVENGCQCAAYKSSGDTLANIPTTIDGVGFQSNRIDENQHVSRSAGSRG